MIDHSIVIPVLNEGGRIKKVISDLLESIDASYEVLIVVDDAEDQSLHHLQKLRNDNKNLSFLINDFGSGPANAIRFGMKKAQGNVVVVFMSDGCDDPKLVTELVRLVRRGVAIACASRYSRGGQLVGGRRLKQTLSRLAGITFSLLTGVGTKDATNSFKAYDLEFLNSVSLESTHGFEIGLELVAKARRLNKPVAELPTIWIDRSFGESNFKLVKWLPYYLKWYIYGLGIGRN
jgi:glycosyltransferase involved in cell wall biosynthesis